MTAEMIPFKVDDERFYPSPFGQVPSVTTIIAILAKPGLIPWAAGKAVDNMRPTLEMLKAGMLSIADMDVDKLLASAKKEHKVTKEEGADIGRKLHELIADYYRLIRNGATAKEADNAVGEVVSGQKDPQIIRAWAAFKGWDEEYKPTPILVELPVFSHYKYAGTMDFYCRMKDDRFFVIDWKSANAIYEDTSMQVAAYGAALMETAPIAERIDGWGCLRLGKNDGIPEWKEYSGREADVAFHRFVKLTEYWHLTNDWKCQVRAEKKSAKEAAKPKKKVRMSKVI